MRRAHILGDKRRFPTRSRSTPIGFLLQALNAEAAYDPARRPSGAVSSRPAHASRCVGSFGWGEPLPTFASYTAARGEIRVRLCSIRDIEHVRSHVGRCVRRVGRAGSAVLRTFRTLLSRVRGNRAPFRRPLFPGTAFQGLHIQGKISGYERAPVCSGASPSGVALVGGGRVRGCCAQATGSRTAWPLLGVKHLDGVSPPFFSEQYRAEVIASFVKSRP